MTLCGVSPCHGILLQANKHANGNLQIWPYSHSFSLCNLACDPHCERVLPPQEQKLNHKGGQHQANPVVQDSQIIGDGLVWFVGVAAGTQQSDSSNNTTRWSRFMDCKSQVFAIAPQIHPMNTQPLQSTTVHDALTWAFASSRHVMMPADSCSAADVTMSADSCS